MAEFTSRWLRLPNALDCGGDKTDESPSGTSGTRADGHISSYEIQSEVPTCTPDNLPTLPEGDPWIHGRSILPAGCIASRFACPVLGPCDRYLGGRPCLVAESCGVAV